MEIKCLNPKKENNLCLIELFSKDNPMTEIDATDLNEKIMQTFEEKAYVVAWLDDQVVIRTLAQGDILFDLNETQLDQTNRIHPKYLRQMRIFTKAKELYVYQSGGKIQNRLREDDFDGRGTMAVVAEQILFGTKVEKTNTENVTTTITEDRGTTLTLPFINISVDAKKQRVALKTLNYIDCHKSTHQANYVDCRFVGFTNNGKCLS